MCRWAWLEILALASRCQSRVPAAHGVRKRHTPLVTHSEPTYLRFFLHLRRAHLLLCLHRVLEDQLWPFRDLVELEEQECRSCRLSLAGGMATLRTTKRTRRTMTSERKPNKGASEPAAAARAKAHRRRRVARECKALWVPRHSGASLASHHLAPSGNPAHRVLQIYIDIDSIET